ncbi:MAG: hypothetical protein ACPG32_04460 [Akkermansiaceae bacterium]
MNKPPAPQIYVQSQGKTWGPYQQHELAAHAAAGKFSATDLANIAGSPLWQPLNTLVSFQPPVEKKSVTPAICMIACLLGTILCFSLASSSPVASGAFGTIALCGFLSYATTRMF